MRKYPSILSLVFCAACGVATKDSQDGGRVPTSAPAAAVKVDAGTTIQTAVALTAGAGVTRHLPGTLMTTATGKYYYLVRSDATIAPFASEAVVTASGYGLKQAIVVSVDELDCYGRAAQITAALLSPKSGFLRDGTLVREQTVNAVYAVSDGVAWPIVSEAVFKLAGYDASNVIFVADNALAAKVAGIGDCSAGIACLDQAYLVSCAEDDAGATIPITTVSETATATSTSTATATQTASGVGFTPTQRAAAGILRHLPGTVITAGSGKYYLVNDDDTISPFASASLVVASGYKANMVIIVSAEELACYDAGEPISAALPALSGGLLRDGAIVKEKSDASKATYVVSGGVAWPVITGTVFEAAGYTFNATIKVEEGHLGDYVLEVGDCELDFFCLTAAYSRSCANSDSSTSPPSAPLGTGGSTPLTTGGTGGAGGFSGVGGTGGNPAVTATAVSTGTKTASATATKTQTAIQTQPEKQTETETPTVTQTSVSATTVLTGTKTASATATLTHTQTQTTTVVDTVTQSATATVTSSATVTATATKTTTAASTSTVTLTATSTQTQTQPPAIDLSWVYEARGSELCLNAAYFAGDEQAVLLVWEGPGADALKGPVAFLADGRFCWDFAERAKGLYRFWADVPDPGCETEICSRDSVSGNGAMYMTAPKATPAAKKWLYCLDTGCDGMAYWDGASLTPAGS